MHPAIWGVFGSAILAVAPAPERNYQFDCGVNALLVLSELEDRHLEVPALFDALPPRHPRGYSMEELMSASDRLGLRLAGIRLVGEDLSIRVPAIFYLEGKPDGHFAVLRPVGVTGKMVQVIDPPLPPRVLDYRQLRAIPGWTGRVLVRREPWWSRFRLPLLIAGIGLLLSFGIRPLRRSLGLTVGSSGSPSRLVGD